MEFRHQKLNFISFFGEEEDITKFPTQHAVPVVTW